MLKDDGTGKYLLSFENEAIIRRIPLERRGVTKKNVEWTLGGMLCEVFENDCDGSAMLYVSTFDTELIEQINTIGVGKRVKIKYHISTRENYDNYKTDITLDEICGLTDSESYIYNKKKKNATDA